MTEHGKVLAETRGGVQRGIENVEHACGVPTLMMGDTVEQIAVGIDSASWRQPSGVFGTVEGLEGGYWVAATVFEDVPPDVSIATEKVSFYTDQRVVISRW